jgi:hypothetical protein
MTRSDLRATMLAVVVAINGIAALPLARKADHKSFERKLAQDEVRRWQGLLAGVGLGFTREELTEGAFTFAKGSLATRKFLLDPFKPWFHFTGTGQAWGLFTYPDRYPGRLLVEAREGEGEWVLLYAALDAEHAFNRDKLVYRRVRGVYDSSSEKVGTSYDPFCSWIAAEVFAARPQYEEVRVRFLTIHTHEPGEQGDTLTVEGEKNARTRHRP